MEKKRVFYGWWVVLAGLVIVLVGSGAASASTVSSILIASQFDWPIGATSMLYAVSRFVGIFALLVVGPLIDRFGTRVVILAGAAVAAICSAVLSLVSSLGMLYLVSGVLLPLGFVALFYLAPYAAVANWFQKRRCLVLSLLVALSIVGEAAGPVVVSLGFETAGWEAGGTLIAVAAMVLVIGGSLSLVIRHKPEQHGYLPDGEGPQAERRPGALPEEFSLQQAMQTRAFWMLAVGLALATAAQSAVRTHLIALGVITTAQSTVWAHLDVFWTNLGLGSQTVGATRGLLVLAAIPLMLLFGYLGDIRSKRYLLMIVVALQGISVLVLMPVVGTGQVYFLMVAFSFGGALLPLMLAIRADYFGRKAFAAIAGFMVFFSVPWGVFDQFIGWAFEITGIIGSYAVVLLLVSLLSFVAATLFFFARPPELAGVQQGTRWLVALLLSVFLGVFGIDRFYMGRLVTGALKFLTLGGLGIWWLTDLILIAANRLRDFNGRALVKGRVAQAATG